MSAALVPFQRHITRIWACTKHEMGIKEGGNLAIMAGAGPMGLGALTYALHRDVRPSRVVVADVNQERLDRAEELFPVAEYKEMGIDLHFVNTGKYDDPVAGAA